MKKLFSYLVLLGLLTLGIFILQKRSPEKTRANLHSGARILKASKEPITSLVFRSGELEYELKKSRKLWAITSPLTDRADTALVETILLSLNNATVIEPLEGEGFTARYNVEFKSAEKTHQHFAIGKPLPFFDAQTERQAVEVKDLLSNVTYAAFMPYVERISLSSITDLRDHRPFLFNPANLLSISQLKESTELLLSRTGSNAPWFLTKPLTVRTDVKEVKSLIEFLFKLKATSVEEAAMKPAQVLNTIRLQSATAKNSVQKEVIEVTLDGKLYSPSRNLLFTFEGMETLVDTLDFSVDRLRSKTLSSLNLAAVNYIFLNSKEQSSPVVLQIKQTTNGLRWMYQDLTGWNPANELAVGEFIKTLTQTQFTQFTNRVLDKEKASHQISIVSRDDSTLTYYGDFTGAEKVLHRAGTPTSVILNQEQVNALSTQSVAWKDTKLWNLSRVNLVGLLREQKKSQEAYSYDYLLESWKSQTNGVNTTVDLDELAANSYLDQLEGLRAFKWLSADQADGFRAQPIQLQLTVLEKKYDTEGNNVGLQQDKLTVRAVKRDSVLYFAELDSRPNEPFLLSKQSFQILSKPLHYKE